VNFETEERNGGQKSVEKRKLIVGCQRWSGINIKEKLRTASNRKGLEIERGSLEGE